MPMRSLLDGAFLVGLALFVSYLGAEDTSIIIGFLIAVIVRLNRDRA